MLKQRAHYALFSQLAVRKPSRKRRRIWVWHSLRQSGERLHYFYSQWQGTLICIEDLHIRSPSALQMLHWTPGDCFPLSRWRLQAWCSHTSFWYEHTSLWYEHTSFWCSFGARIHPFGARIHPCVRADILLALTILDMCQKSKSDTFGSDTWILTHTQCGYGAYILWHEFSSEPATGHCRSLYHWGVSSSRHTHAPHVTRNIL